MLEQLRYQYGRLERLVEAENARRRARTIGPVDSSMDVIEARTGNEALEYMRLATGEHYPHRLSTQRIGSQPWREEDRAFRYALDCHDDGAHFEFVVGVGDPPAGSEDDWLHFGYGPEPSRLLDPGEWFIVLGNYVALAQRLQERMQARGSSTIEEIEEISDYIVRARAAALEVLKFASAGSDEISPSTIRTAFGRQAYRERSEQFRRSVLEKGIADAELALEKWAALVEEADRP